MRVAFLAFGTRGDVQPLIAAGRRLRRDGHDVVIGASGVFAEAVRAHGLEFHTVGRDIDTLLQRNALELLGPPLRSLRPALAILREEIDASFDAAYELAADADALVAGLHPAAASVAEAHGIPHRTLLYCPQALPSRHHPPIGLPWFSLPKLVNEWLGRAVAHGIDVALADALNRHRRRHGLRAIGHFTARLLSERTVVASDPVLGELPPDAPPGTLQIGSIALDTNETLDPALERFLEIGAPPVCVGFGSMPDPDPAESTARIVEALGACGRRGVILSGWSAIGGAGVPPGIFVARSAPHAALLPRVALLVHHGGAGTTAAAARAGVPQVIVPHVADQPYWGEQIFRRGLGSAPIPRRAMSARRLARAIQDALAPEIAERAAEVGAMIARIDAASALARIVARLAPDTRAQRRAA